MGEIKSDKPTSVAIDQFTPDVLPLVIKLFARPTPRIDPIKVWELETGSPYHQVDKFQMTPARRSDTTITMDRVDALSTKRSTGRRFTMLNAIAVPPSKTPRKLQMPE